ncbi:MAG: TRAP transporter small permease subunit [Burkholderiales bacterium]|nr:TRAP transporter small permease subunit [Burkholderiales bacterium]
MSAASHPGGAPIDGALPRLARRLDAVALWSGRAVSWMILPMVASLVYEVTMRYAFSAPTTWAYDMTYMLYGSFFMLGSAYTLMRKGHIRTDMFYEKWSVRTQGRVDAACYLLFFFPALIAFLLVSWDFFQASWDRQERMVTSPWMPLVWPFKLSMPVATALMLLQGVSEFIKSCIAARRGVWI